MPTKTKDESTPDVVDDAPESVPTLEELQTQLRQAEEWRIAVIRNAQQIADEKNWCSEFDALMAKVGLPKRRIALKARFRLWLPVPIPKGTHETYAWGNTEAAKTAALDVLQEALDKAREGDWTGFQNFDFYDTQEVRAPYTIEDFKDAPMRLTSNGKPLIQRPAK